MSFFGIGVRRDYIASTTKKENITCISKMKNSKAEKNEKNQRQLIKFMYKIGMHIYAYRYNIDIVYKYI